MKGGLFKPTPIKLHAAAIGAAVIAAAAAARVLLLLELQLSPFVTAPLPTAASPALLLESKE